MSLLPAALLPCLQALKTSALARARMALLGLSLACGVRHCVGVASGTAGLGIALIAAGLRPGDEVIIPAHTYVATAVAVPGLRSSGRC